MRPPCLTPRYPPGVFPGGPLSGLPVSPSGPLVTLGWVTPEPRVTFAGVSPGALRHAPPPAPRPPGACLPRPGARPPLCPRPPVILPSNGVQAPAPPPAPAPTRHAPCAPVPSSRSRMAGRAPRPRPPRSPERQPPSTARSPRSPRTPTPPPPARRCAALCGGARGPRGAGHAPSTFSRNAPPMPHPPIPPGGLSWGAFVRVACVTQRPLGHAWLGHPGAPGHVCRGQPWGPSSRSAARAPPPGGLPAAAGGATASLSPPPCHSPLQRRAGSRAAPRSRPHQTRPLRPCPLLAVTHGWAGAAPPTPPFP